MVNYQDRGCDWSDEKAYCMSVRVQEHRLSHAKLVDFHAQTNGIYACESDQPQVLSCIHHMISTQYLKQILNKYRYIKPVFVMFTRVEGHTTLIWCFLPNGGKPYYTYKRVEYVSRHVKNSLLGFWLRRRIPLLIIYPRLIQVICN